MVGMFDVAQLLFTKLYVIHVYHWEILYDMGIRLFANGTQETYQKLFTTIQDRCSKLGFDVDPVTVIIEQSVISALKSSFRPQITIHGCFYHLTLYKWRKIQSLGLVQCHREEENIKLFCGMLYGLTF